MASEAESKIINKEAYVRSKMDDVAYCVGFFSYQSARVQLEREVAEVAGQLELARRIGSLAYFDYTGLKALIFPDRDWPTTIQPVDTLYDDMISFEQEVFLLRKPVGHSNG